ncbi:MAG: Uma2 family endonuclease [Lachnospiraceae bacterium]|nr:Uma2 family endonuclease [Lachnospiraceae bacterium]
MDALQEQFYTIEDIYGLPDGERAELVDGQIYYMAPPRTRHQRLVMFISRKIANYIDEQKGLCEVLPAPFAVFLNKDDLNYFEPDISVICDRDKLDEKGCNGAPDWVVEIVSPGSNKMDYVIKTYKYMDAGVREYWIVDPEKNKITVHDFTGDNINEYTCQSQVPSLVLEGFKIDFTDLQEW